MWKRFFKKAIEKSIIKGLEKIPVFMSGQATLK